MEDEQDIKSSKSDDVKFKDGSKNSSKDDFKKKKSFRSKRSGSSKNRKPKSGSKPSQKPNANFGFYRTNYKAYSVSEEASFIPFGMVHMDWQPFGSDTHATDFDVYSTAYRQTVINKLRELGFQNNFTILNLQRYGTAVGRLVHLDQYLDTIRYLSSNTGIHTAPSIAAFAAGTINGTVVARARQIKAMLETISFPSHMVTLFREGTKPTLSREGEPDSPIRMFTPTDLKPTDGDPLTAANLLAYITLVMGEMTIPSNVEYISVLPNIWPKIATTERIISLTRNDSTINNLLNVPYFVGASPYPSGGITSQFQYFYQNKLSELSAKDYLTYSIYDTDADFHQDTVMGFNGESNPLRNIVTSGSSLNTYGDSSGFASFGTVWEDAILLGEGLSIFTDYQLGSIQALNTGLAATLFSE